MMSLDHLLDLPSFDFDVDFGLDLLEPQPEPAVTTSSGATDPLDPSFSASQLSEEELRRLRRMKSNRESARRSRMRKRSLVEELWADLNRLRSQNRDLSGRLAAVLRRSFVVRLENERLGYESTALSRRLANLRQVAICQVYVQRLVAAPPPSAPQPAGEYSYTGSAIRVGLPSCCDQQQALASLIT